MVDFEDIFYGENLKNLFIHFYKTVTVIEESGPRNIHEHCYSCGDEKTMRCGDLSLEELRKLCPHFQKYLKLSDEEI